MVKSGENARRGLRGRQGSLPTDGVDQVKESEFCSTCYRMLLRGLKQGSDTIGFIFIKIILATLGIMDLKGVRIEAGNQGIKWFQ